MNIKTTDTDLRAFFAEFDPSDIYIFKSKNTRSRLKFRQPRVYALVTVLAKNGQQDAIKKLTNERLNGKYLKLSPAYLNKIEQVKSAAMGKSQIASPQPQDDQELISEEPAVLDASADVPESPVEIATEIILEAPLEA